MALKRRPIGSLKCYRVGQQIVVRYASLMLRLMVIGKERYENPQVNLRESSKSPLAVLLYYAYFAAAEEQRIDTGEVP